MNAFTGQTFQMNQIINLKEVIRITGLSRATIYNIMDEHHKHYDLTFPQTDEFNSWSCWLVNKGVP